MPRLALAPFLLLALAACRVEHGLNRPPADYREPPAPKLQVKQSFDPKTGKLTHEYTQLVFVDRRPVKDGKEVKYSPTGEKVVEGEWKQGKRFGAWRFYYENGKPKSESYYGDARTPTTMTFWHDNGQVSMQGPAINGSRQGTWRVRLDDGSFATGPYVDDKRQGLWVVTWPDGVKRAEGPMLKGVRSGAWVEYDELGRLRARGSYKDDLRTGVWVMFDETGAKAGTGVMRGELRDGHWVEWETDGARLEGDYVAGRRDGPWIVTSADEKTVLAQGSYTAGLRVGSWNEIGTDGSSRFVGPYVDDQRHGLWEAFAPGGERLGAVRYERGIRMETAP